MPIIIGLVSIVNHIILLHVNALIIFTKFHISISELLALYLSV